MVRLIPNHVHGTAGGYSNWDCRCSPCTEANAAKARRAKLARTNAPIPRHVHGTDNGYTNYDCRCDPCTAAHTEVARQRRRSPRTQGEEE